MTAPEGILALDLATKTGFAHWRPGSPVILGTKDMPKTGADVGWFLDEFCKWLRPTIASMAPVRVVFEAPWIGPQTHQDTARKLMCLAGVTEMVSRWEGALCFEANVQEVRRHFIGNGRTPRKAAKAATIERCKLYGQKPRNDDEADAFALLDYYAAIRGAQVPWPRTALHAAAAQGRAA